jgi:hypothetical protein
VGGCGTRHSRTPAGQSQQIARRPGSGRPGGPGPGRRPEGSTRYAASLRTANRVPAKDSPGNVSAGKKVHRVPAKDCPRQRQRWREGAPCARDRLPRRRRRWREGAPRAPRRLLGQRWRWRGKSNVAARKPRARVRGSSDQETFCPGFPGVNGRRGGGSAAAHVRDSPFESRLCAGHFPAPALPARECNGSRLLEARNRSDNFRFWLLTWNPADLEVSRLGTLPTWEVTDLAACN